MTTLHDFSFPLNVYGAMLQWTEGRVDYLHYGLFEHDDEPIWRAQERASARLWAQMPPPCRVLEVGIGLGHTLARLRGRGYRAVGITPEPAQRAFARQTYGAELDIEITRLEDFAPETAGFDLMLLQESAQYIQPLALFEAADRLLSRDRATLLVMDEFALRRESDADFGLHLLSHFTSLAERFGWELAHEEDVSDLAAPTVAVLQKLTRQHAVRVQQEFGLSVDEFDALERSNQRYAECYRRGVFGYRVLRFERGQAPELRPVALDEHRAAAMRSLFHRVFDREMGASEWSWKYGDGRGRGVGLVARDGSMKAFYGGLTRPLRLRGQPANGCQVCDVMVDPRVHRSLARRGPAHQVAASFLEAEIGWSRAHAVGFGFPTERALGVAERLGLYQRADEMVQLSWDPVPSLVGSKTWQLLALDARSLQAGDRPWSELQALWEAMAAGLTSSVLGVRDPGWVRYRYGLKPGSNYELAMVCEAETGLHLGLLVWRRHADHLELLDLIAAPERMPSLIDALRCHVAGTASGPLRVQAWITRSHAHLLQRPGDGAVLESMNLFVPANHHTPGVPPQALAGRWFLMAGDTDFR